MGLGPRSKKKVRKMNPWNIFGAHFDGMRIHYPHPQQEVLDEENRLPFYTLSELSKILLSKKEVGSLQKLCIEALEKANELEKIVHILPEEFEHFDLVKDKLRNQHQKTFKNVMTDITEKRYRERLEKDEYFAKDVELVMAQVNCTLIQAVEGLDKHEGDIVNTIMYLQY